MKVTLTYRDTIGHGVTMTNVGFGYDYFEDYAHQVNPKSIVNTFATTDFNAFGINQVDQVISRVADVAVCHLMAGASELITISGARTDVGQYQLGGATAIESVMDGGTLTVADDVLAIVGTKYGDYLSGDINNRNEIHGRAGADTIVGDWNSDTLFGDGGRDSLDGGSAPDTLNGGSGADTLSGGNGRDTFIFNDVVGRDRITDLARGETIRLQDTTAAPIDPTSLHLTQLSTGVLLTAGDHIEVLLAGRQLTMVETYVHISFETLA